jgi:alpha-L-arabinofuranosidase
MTRLEYLIAGCFLSLTTGAGAIECLPGSALEATVEVNTSSIIRQIAPKELFGFNVPWRDFQQGYFRSGKVRPEVADLLSAFAGASYRYPGGSPSNSFEWRKSIGPANLRPAMHSDFERFAPASFGIDEFADFVSQVDGKAIITVNLSGPYRAATTPDDIAHDVQDLLKHVREKTSFGCVGGPTCRVSAWELGNEMDWAPYKWPANVYIQRVNTVLDLVSPTMPEANWIAGGRTAPWDKSALNYQQFNTALADALASRASGIAIHPYYDGISIPSASDYVARYGKTWSQARPDAKVFVTEHARWPSQPANGRWENNWYQATGLGGAISSADFLLAMLTNGQVASANWHALSTEGPWQLIRWNRSNDQLYPSPVYWGLRALRDGYLDQVVTTKYKASPINNSDYSGGYDVRVVGMKQTNDQRVSVLGINRKDVPLRLRIQWIGGKNRPAGEGVLRTVSGQSVSDDNTNDQPFKLQMETEKQLVLPARKQSFWCVPARSVFSVVEP